jgi:hypothetical protein
MSSIQGCKPLQSGNESDRYGQLGYQPSAMYCDSVNSSMPS